VNVASAVQQGKAALRGLILPHPRSSLRPCLQTAPLVVAGMFRTGNGLGRAARAYYDALRLSGLDPQAVDVSGLLNQANMPASVPLTGLAPARPGTLILFVNPPEIERVLMGLGLRRWHDWRIIGAWAWELSVAPAEWRRQARFVSEIWGPSRFAADAFAAAYDRPVHYVPLFVPQAPLAMTEAPAAAVAPARPLHVLTMADARSSLERKNPVAAVKIFKEAFQDSAQARMTLKCRGLDLYPDYAAILHQTIGGDPRIRLIDETLSDTSQSALQASADIVLSPHRSEGFGLHLAEAMALGKCVIATGWSGNLDFMPPGSAALIPFNLVPVSDTTGVYRPRPGDIWADPDIGAGAALLRELASDPARRAAMGAAALQAVANCLPHTTCRQVLEAV